MNDYYATRYASEIGFFLEEHGYPVDEYMVKEIFFDEKRFVISGFLPDDRKRDPLTVALFGRESPGTRSWTSLYKPNWRIEPR